MNGADVLSTISELALGLIGFTGIVVVFGRRADRLTALERFRLFTLLMNGFGALFLALLPFALSGLGMAEARVIRLVSMAVVVYSIGILGVWLSRVPRFWSESPEIFDRRVFGAVLAGHAANVLVQLFNATGWLWEPNVGVFLFGLIWFLLHGCQQFVRILFVRPAEAD